MYKLIVGYTVIYNMEIDHKCLNQNIKLFVLQLLITRATQNRGLLSQIGGNSGVIILRKNNYIYQICSNLIKYN